MSAEKETLDQKFRDWKKDLDRRCAEHLAKHPERPKKEPQKALPPIPANTAPLFLERPRYSVLESVVNPGTWYVYKNIERIMTFFGENAQRNATKFVGDILNS